LDVVRDVLVPLVEAGELVFATAAVLVEGVGVGLVWVAAVSAAASASGSDSQTFTAASRPYW